MNNKQISELIRCEKWRNCDIAKKMGCYVFFHKNEIQKCTMS